MSIAQVTTLGLSYDYGKDSIVLSFRDEITETINENFQVQ
jgi:hypothetical protein